MGEITITIEEFRQLKHADAMLDALHAGGVGSWTWFEDSIEENYDAATVDREVDRRIAE